MDNSKKDVKRRQRKIEENRPQGDSTHNNGTMEINANPVPGTDDSNCAECPNECIKVAAQSFEKKLTAGIVDCSEQANNDKTSPMSNEKNADKVYPNGRTAGQDACAGIVNCGVGSHTNAEKSSSGLLKSNKKEADRVDPNGRITARQQNANGIDGVSIKGSINDLGINIAEIMQATDELRTDRNLVEVNPKRAIVNKLIPSEGDYDENSSKNIGEANSNESPNTRSGNASNTTDLGSKCTRDSQKQEAKSNTFDSQQVKRDRCDHDNCSSENHLRNAEITDIRGGGIENELEGFTNPEERRICLENQCVKQNYVKIRDGSNQGSEEYLSENNLKCNSGNEPMSSGSRNLQLIKRVTVKLSKDWLNAMESDCAMLRTLSPEYKVNFDEVKMEIFGNMHGLRRVRKMLNEAAQKKCAYNCFSEECQLNRQDTEDTVKTNGLLMYSLDQNFEHCTPSTPLVPPRGKKTKAQREGNENDSSSQKIAEKVMLKDQKPELVFSSEFNNSNRFAGNSASGGSEQESCNSSANNDEMINENFKNIQVTVTPEKQRIVRYIKKEYSASIEFDADIYDYISRTTDINEIQRKYDLKLECSATDDISFVRMLITAKNSTGTHFDECVKKLEKLIQEVSTRHCIVPQQYRSLIDVKGLDSTIHNENQKKKVFIIFDEAHTTWKVIGSSHDANRFEKFINKHIKSEIQAFETNLSHQIQGSKKSVHGSQCDSGIGKSNVVNTQPQHYQKTESNFPNISAQSHKFDASAFSIVTTASSSSENSLIFTTGPNHVITVSVECRDMLKPFSNGKLPDAIVSPCDGVLRCKSGLSKAIMDAAGPHVRLQCDTRICSQNLGVTGYFQTDAGNMAANGLKFIMHAVGPDPVDYKRNNDKVRELTSETYYNCLIGANSSSGINSMALPLLGVGIYQVPIDLIVWTLLAALEKFSTHLTKSSELLKLKNIYVVCNDLPTIQRALRVLRILIPISTV